ncbi:MAG: hypothetical protein V4616_12455 [Bacteroidota bacterium]
MNTRCLALLVLFVSVSAGVFAQKQITLINGLTYNFEEIKVDENWISFTYYTKNKKLKDRTLAYEDVFTIQDGKKETVLYLMAPDTVGLPAYPEMKMFVAGQQSGRKLYNGTRHFIMGAVIGAAGGIAVNSFIAGAPIPVLYTLLSTAFPVSSNRFSSDPVTDDTYRYGQKKQYKRQRTGTALISSVAGVAAGLIVGHFVAQ